LANLERLKKSFLFFQNAIGSSNFVFELSKLFEQLANTMKGSTKAGTILGTILGMLINVIQALFGILTAIPAPLKAVFVLWGILMIPLLIPLLAIAAVLLLIDDFISHMQGKGGFFTELLGEDGFFKFINEFREGLLSVVADFWKEMVTFLPNLLMNAGLTGLNLMADPIGTANALYENWKANSEADSREARGLPPRIETERGPAIDQTTLAPVGGSSVDVNIYTEEPLSATVTKNDKGG
jgi:hypothetical protein